MSDRPSRGLLDTSVVIDIDEIDSALLPTEAAISAVTLAELAAGPHAADNEQDGAAGRTASTGRPLTGTPCPSTRMSRVPTVASSPR